MNISSAFRSLLTMLTAFFSAGEKIGKTLDNLATVAEETSASYVDDARADRAAKAAQRAQEVLIAEKALAHAASTSKKPVAATVPA